MSLKNGFKRSFEGGMKKTNSFFEKESWGGVLGVFEKPKQSKALDINFQYLFIVLIIVLLFSGSFYFMNKTDVEKSEVVQIKKIVNNNPWYAVKLVDGDIIYGKITDINTDPLVVESVYYNYDQKKTENDQQKKKISENGDLRLVKRGNETHGPDGKLQIFRAQVVFMENLRADSKVLRVIEDNEK